jgi:hypothetical protein
MPPFPNDLHLFTPWFFLGQWLIQMNHGIVCTFSPLLFFKKRWMKVESAAVTEADTIPLLENEP